MRRWTGRKSSMNSICQDMTSWAHCLSRSTSLAGRSVGAGRHGSLVSKEFSISCQETGPIHHSHSEKSIKSPGKGAHTLPSKIHHVSALECAHSSEGRSLLPLSSAKSNRHMQMASTRDNEGIRIRNYLPTRDRCMYGKCGGRKFLLAVYLRTKIWGP